MIRTLALALVLGGCGQSYCERGADYAEDCGQTYSDEDLATCEEQLSECSKEDEKLLGDSFDCMEKAGLLVCDDEEAADAFGSAPGTTGTTTNFDDLEAIFACAAPLFAVSPDCPFSVQFTMQ